MEAVSQPYVDVVRPRDADQHRSPAGKKSDQRIVASLRSDDAPDVWVPIDSLAITFPLRLDGENVAHTRILAELGEDLPPIIVRRCDMQVIDGMHRVRAAILRGQERIRARFFEGDEQEAFLLAVRVNITHGLPLTLADRAAAAKRLIRLNPWWSDRAIASFTGLSPKTVGAIRRRSSEEIPRLNARVGRDGRFRPVEPSEGRQLAQELISANPDASLREVAHAAGISLGTAHSVKKRLNCGDGPVLPGQRVTEEGKPPEQAARNHRAPDIDAAAVVQNMRRDPCLRLTETGRMLLRLLDVHTIGQEDWERLFNNVPEHWTESLANVAKECSQAWREFSDRLTQRAKSNHY